MKQLFMILLIFLISITVSACFNTGGNSEQSNSQAQVSTVKNNTQAQVISAVKAMSEEVRLSAGASMTDDGRALVKGNTNLPDGATLLVSLSNEAGDLTAQDKPVVSDGQFIAGPFGPKTGLRASRYTIEVLMPAPFTQPERVKAVIGNEGQYLSGPLVEDSSFGRTVKYSFNYTIDSNISSEQLQPDYAATASEVRLTIEQLLETGRSMEPYRNTNNYNAMKTCGEIMRGNKAKAEEVRRKAENLPTEYFTLKVASIDIFPCVTCVDDAIEDCERVAQSLRGQ